MDGHVPSEADPDLVAFLHGFGEDIPVRAPALLSSLLQCWRRGRAWLNLARSCPRCPDRSWASQDLHSAQVRLGGAPLPSSGDPLAGHHLDAGLLDTLQCACLLISPPWHLSLPLADAGG